MNYTETVADDQADTEQVVVEQQQHERGRGRGKRAAVASQPSDDSDVLQPATQRGDFKERAQLGTDEEVGAQQADAMKQRQDETEVAADALDDVPERSVEEAVDSPQSDEKEEAEQSDSDDEWSEEKPKRSAAAADGRQTIVLSDDDVDDVFALTRPAHAARLKDARKETSNSNKRKRKALASKKSSTLLPHSSASSSAKSPPSQRSPVTVSKVEAILLEDSLDAPPARPSASAPAPSSTAPTRPSTVTSLTASRKAHKPLNSKLPFKPRSSDSTDGPPSSQAANIASMRAILGPALPDSTLLRFLVSANYNCERAISNILDSPQLLTQSHATVPASHHNGTHEQRQPMTQPQQHEQSTNKKRNREASDGDEDVDEDDEDEQRWSDKSAVKQPTADNEERRESEKEVEKEEGPAPVPWDRKLLVVLRVEAGCTTEGTRIVSLDESVTFRDQSRDTYHQRMIRTQLQQQQSQQARNRKQTKQLRKDLRAERRKEHRILRFVPSAHQNALEIGTLPRAVSDVLVPLFDRRLIDLSAVVTAPCPAKFDLLSTIPLLLSVYALPALFRLKREVRVETKGFLGRVVSTAADQQLNPVDTFLSLLSAFHIEPVSSSIREEGNHSSPPRHIDAEHQSSLVPCSRFAPVLCGCLVHRGEAGLCTAHRLLCCRHIRVQRRR